MIRYFIILYDNAHFKRFPLTNLCLFLTNLSTATIFRFNLISSSLSAMMNAPLSVITNLHLKRNGH